MTTFRTLGCHCSIRKGTRSPVCRIEVVGVLGVVGVMGAVEAMGIVRAGVGVGMGVGLVGCGGVWWVVG